ncbi:MAG: SagB/ThcOx family dehydrogenase [Candidatus Zixiibacteriota bacterium]|nr:MAG: SagB/ThcOx family dehydrogenase [candidate division Zixibacteria bacterium]
MPASRTPGQTPDTIELPEPSLQSDTSVEMALQQRRSVREYSPAELTLAEVAQLLWAAQGVTHPEGRRTAPSGGALYPLETYLAAGDVAGLSAGVYRYLPALHALERVTAGDRRTELSRAALGQSPVWQAPAGIILAAVYPRITGKYGQRGITYAHIEAGAAAQNLALQAVSLGLGTVCMGAFQDSAVVRALGLPEDQVPLLILPVGHVE